MTDPWILPSASRTPGIRQECFAQMSKAIEKTFSTRLLPHEWYRKAMNNTTCERTTHEKRVQEAAPKGNEIRGSEHPRAISSPTSVQIRHDQRKLFMLSNFGSCTSCVRKATLVPKNLVPNNFPRHRATTCMRAVNRSTIVSARKACRDGLHMHNGS